MKYEVKKSGSGSAAVNDQRLSEAVTRLLRIERPRHRRLWAYYANPMVCRAVEAGESGSDRPYRQAQEWGLPSRITGIRSGRTLDGSESAGRVSRKEVVIENDIGWRIDTMVEYLFGKPIVVESAAPDANRRDAISRLARAILAANGGILFLQQMALIGAVHGFVDVLVKVSGECREELKLVVEGGSCSTRELGEPPAASAGNAEGMPGASVGGAEEGVAPAAQDSRSESAANRAAGRPVGGPADSEIGDQENTGAGINPQEEAITRLARLVRLEIVEPARALPLLSALDCRAVEAYAQCYEMDRAGDGDVRQGASREKWWKKLLRAWPAATDGAPDRQKILVTELITADKWVRYENQMLVEQGENSLGEIPLVHIQNTALPFEYSGSSDVEGLIPLQDELNTRLSDRAHRIALQSFKMYLGKGIDNFLDMPVSPGRMWMTDNTEAQVQEFGGDENAPSESLHITDLREALDKSSGVSPIAAGAIKNRIGRLTSAAALRITLISLLAKTEKKRTAYGAGIGRMIELSLAWLDRAGLFKTTPEERRIDIHWPSPLPENEIERLQEAEIKLRLGVAKEVVLKEVGY